MGQEHIGAFIGIFTGIIGLAIISVVLSKQSDSSNVIKAVGTAFGGAISAATGGVNSATNPGTFGSVAGVN